MVRLYRVVEIDEVAQFLLPMFRTVKQLFLMPHLRQGTYNPFLLTVGLRTGNPGDNWPKPFSYLKTSIHGSIIGILQHLEHFALAFGITFVVLLFGKSVEIVAIVAGGK